MYLVGRKEDLTVNDHGLAPTTTLELKGGYPRIPAKEEGYPPADADG
jgi:hypothetical protein